MVEVLNKNLQDAKDALAPIKSRTVLVRTMNPWFNDEIRDQMRRMRNQEKKWRKYKLESNWRAFKSEGSKYGQMLREARRGKIAENVNKCDNNVKKLYNQVNHLTDRNLYSPFPNSESDEMLANEFADFSMEKIKRIRDSLEVHPTYHQQAIAKAFMCKFEQVTKKEVIKCIREMASKSCKLDAIPTTTLKQVLNTIIAPITRIVNMLLESGIFASKWKTAIICPLLKKAGLDLILSNFRPVSNLSLSPSWWKKWY